MLTLAEVRDVLRPNVEGNLRLTAVPHPTKCAAPAAQCAGSRLGQGTSVGRGCFGLNVTVGTEFSRIFSVDGRCLDEASMSLSGEAVSARLRCLG